MALMRQVICEGTGSVDVLTVRNDQPVPDVRPGEVRVRVAAAGVNRPDILQRMGLYPPPADASPHLGLEVAGQIDAVGEDVNAWSVGDSVCALVAGGGYAEYVCVPAALVMRVPAGMSFLQAAALPETCMTVWANVFERCGLVSGDCFLVHAGASSIGLTAIAMARSAGARVLATVGSPAKTAVCLEAGATAVFSYAQADWPDAVRGWLKAESVPGIDVALDCLGGAVLADTLALMATEGRVASIAQLNGAQVTVDVMRLMLRRLTLTGSTLRARSLHYKAHLARVLQARIWPQLEGGAWLPVVHEAFPVEAVKEAHCVLEARQNCGKVVLTF